MRERERERERERSTRSTTLVTTTKEVPASPTLTLPPTKKERIDMKDIEDLLLDPQTISSQKLFPHPKMFGGIRVSV
jgi:hypothetical protein